MDFIRLKQWLEGIPEAAGGVIAPPTDPPLHLVGEQESGSLQHDWAASTCALLPGAFDSLHFSVRSFS